MTYLIVIAVLILATIIYFAFFKKKEDKVAAPPILPESNASFPRVFQSFFGLDEALNPENIAKHDLYFHAPEAFGANWSGRTSFTMPSIAGTFDASTIQNGLNKRAELKALNPEILLFVQIGFAEGAAETDFLPDYPWWMRDAQGNRVAGWGEGDTQSYFFDLSLPEVRQHCANCCKEAMATGIWDGIMLDVWRDTENHLDIIKRIRNEIGGALIIANGNYRIMPLTASYLNGAYMECGSNPDWKRVEEAVNYNQINTRHPKLTCLEVSGNRLDERTMRMVTCLALTRTNGYALFADPNELLAADHQHKWFEFWDAELGKPISQPRLAGATGVQRDYENGTVVYNPSSQNILLTFPEPRQSMAHTGIGTTHTMFSKDGDIYLKTNV